MKFNTIASIYFVLLLLLSVFIFPMWTVMLSVWFGIFIYVRRKGLDNSLTEYEKKLFYVIAFAYPIVESLIKLVITRDLIPYSWTWLNRVEHFGFSAAIGIMLYPILKKTFKKLQTLESFIFFVGIIVILGNFNEFAEYIIRQALNLTDQKRLTAYYWDTIYDLAINVAGAVFGFMVVSVFQSSNFKLETSN